MIFCNQSCLPLDIGRLFSRLVTVGTRRTSRHTWRLSSRREEVASYRSSQSGSLNGRPPTWSLAKAEQRGIDKQCSVLRRDETVMGTGTIGIIANFEEVQLVVVFGGKIRLVHLRA